jgi:UDP-glucose 4-epimerase
VTGPAAAFAGKRVVVTGGLGLIGARLAARVASAAQAVVVIDALVPEHGGNRLNLPPAANIRVVEHDLRDGRGVRPLVEGADVVFNLAGQRSHTDAMRDPVSDLDHNCRAQLELLEACRTAAPGIPIVFASTRQVYGRVGSIPADESNPVAPVDVNGIHKAAAEEYHRLYDAVHGHPTVILRMTNTYGPGMRIRDTRQGLLSAWIGALVRAEPFAVGGGEQWRDFNYVDDVVDALLLAGADASLRGGVFNLGGAEPIRLRELAELLVDVNGRGTYRVRPMPDDLQRIDIGDYVGDYGAFRARTGWSPRLSLRAGLAQTLEYFRAHAESYL